MIDQNLKEEWLEKVKIQERKDIASERGWGHFTINTALHYAPEEIKADYDVNFQAAIVGNEFFWNLHEKFRNDKEFIFKLVESKYERKSIYDSLGRELKDDPEIFKLCLSRKDDFSWGLTSGIIQNRELIVECIKEHDIYEKLKGFYSLDKEIVGYHLQHHPEAFPSLKKSMKNYFSSPKRKDIIINMLTKATFNKNYIYKELPPELKENLEVVDALLSNAHNNYTLLPEHLQNDKAFALYAIEKYGVVAIGEELRNDREVVEAIVSKNGEHIRYFKHFEKDTGMIEVALKTYDKLNIVPDSMLLQKDLVLKFLNANPENIPALLKRTSSYYDDYEIMKICIEHDAKLFKNVGPRLRQNTELSDLALAATSDFDLLSDNHLKNRNLVLQLLEHSAENCTKATRLKNFLQLYKDDEEVAKKIFTANPRDITFFPTFKADKDFVNFALGKGLNDISLIDSDLWRDKEIAVKFLDLNPHSYSYLPLSVKNDYDIALTAMPKAGYYENVVSNSNLSDDIDFHLKAINKIPSIYEKINKFSPIKHDLRIILQYIESSNALNEPIMLTQEIYGKYGTTDSNSIKSMIMQEQLEECLVVKGSNTKKIKV